MARLSTEPFIVIASVGHRETCERRGESKAIKHSGLPGAKPSNEIGSNESLAHA